MSKSDPSAIKKERFRTIRWVVTIFLVTILVSGIIFTVSDEIMSATSIAVSFCILLVIVFVGIIFDIVGVAVTSADETPFHSMAARKVPGAREALLLLRNAERVSSICNDVVGDICGVVSGSASANIAAQLLMRFEFSWPAMIGLAMSSIVSGLTVGGKAVGKAFAVNTSTKIVYFAGKVIWFLRGRPDHSRKGKKHK
jgi:Mg2+/Co2+ transporter CorB